MKQELKELYRVFTTTKQAINEFMAMLQPVIENAKDDYERLFHHHIYEEEEHRLERLHDLLVLIEDFEGENEELTPLNPKFNRLLQELNLEKFGLHNFTEHLDLALYEFQDEKRQARLTKMRDVTNHDYQVVKQMLVEINEQCGRETSQMETNHQKVFTVGSLIKKV